MLYQPHQPLPRSDVLCESWAPRTEYMGFGVLGHFLYFQNVRKWLCTIQYIRNIWRKLFFLNSQGSKLCFELWWLRDIHRSWHNSCIIPVAYKSRHNANVSIPKLERNTTPPTSHQCPHPPTHTASAPFLTVRSTDYYNLIVLLRSESWVCWKMGEYADCKTE